MHFLCDKYICCYEASLHHFNNKPVMLFITMYYVTLSHLRSKGVSVVKCDVSQPQLPGVLQLPWCATTSQWNVVQLPIGMHIIMLQLPLVYCNDTRKPIQTSCITTLYIDTPNQLSTVGFSY